MGLNCGSPLTRRFFSINTEQSALQIWRSCIHGFNHKISIYGWLNPRIQSPWIQRTYCTMSFYIRGLNIPGFGIHGAPGNNPCGYQVLTVLLNQSLCGSLDYHLMGKLWGLELSEGFTSQFSRLIGWELLPWVCLTCCTVHWPHSFLQGVGRNVLRHRCRRQHLEIAESTKKDSRVKGEALTESATQLKPKWPSIGNG